MAHVELSVSEPSSINSNRSLESSLARWTAAARGAEEYCLVLDAEAVVVAISAAFEHLLGLERSAIGRDLLDGVLSLVDFADGGPMIDGEVSKIPPLLALTSGRLSRGLLRVHSADDACTLDAVATPLIEGDVTVGSLTFFSRI